MSWLIINFLYQYQIFEEPGASTLKLSEALILVSAQVIIAASMLVCLHLLLKRQILPVLEFTYTSEI